MEMDNIIAILTVIATIVLGVIGFIANALIQRKSNSIEIITNTRLERRKETQRIFAKLLMNTDLRYLDFVLKQED